jgi:Flp pilus assembly protein TadD
MVRTQARAATAPSLEQLEQAARAPGTDRAVLLRWGWALYAAGRFSDAAAAARECEAGASGGDPEPGYLLGMALKASGDRAGAAGAFGAAAANAPGMADTVRGAMLRRLAVGHANWLQQGEWNLEPETWVRT